MHRVRFLLVTAAMGVGLAALVVSAGPATAPSAVGDSVGLEIEGDLARQYYRLQTGKAEAPEGLQISTSAQIVQSLADGQYRLEHSLTTTDATGQPRLITLTAVVKGDAFSMLTLPAGATIAASPADPRPSTTTEAMTSTSVKLTGAKGVVLRSWKIDQEISR